MTAALPELPSGRELIRELTNGCKTNLMLHRMAVSAVPDLATRMIFFFEKRSRRFDITERLRGSRVAEEDRKGGQHEVYQIRNCGDLGWCARRCGSRFSVRPVLLWPRLLRG